MMVMKEGHLVDHFSCNQLFADERHPYTKELAAIFGTEAS
jgi:peptide/nickel transport system ATP-binding protein